MKHLATITLTAGAVLLASAAFAQDKVDGLPKTQIQVAGALSNLTLYQNFEQPFWTKTVPELSNGQVTATIKGFNEMGLK
ncbi:MAG: transporter, partial [Castellaniella sp.]